MQAVAAVALLISILAGVAYFFVFKRDLENAAKAKADAAIVRETVIQSKIEEEARSEREAVLENEKKQLARDPVEVGNEIILREMK